MIARLPSAFAAFFLEVVLMEVGTVLRVVRSAPKSLVESQRTARGAEEGGGVD